MSCKPYIELIQKAWTDSLTPEQQESLSTHTAACSACAKEAELLRMVSAAALEPVPEVPADLQASIMAAVRADAESLPERPWWQLFATVPLTVRLAGAAASVVLALLGGVLGAEMATKQSNTTTQAVFAPMSPSISPTLPEPPPAGEDWAASFDAENQDLPLGWYLASESPADGAPATVGPGALREEI